MQKFMQRVTAVLVTTATISSTAICRAEPANVSHIIDNSNRISFGDPVLAPMASVHFCLEHRADCAVTKLVLRDQPLGLTTERWMELQRIDNEVNQEISSDARLGPDTEQWKIAPLYGNCHDYAVTKRHELLANGWPSSDLLLAEVRLLTTGEHHLVLVVRTSDGDLVLDNLNSDVVPVAMTNERFQWVRIQMPQNPYLWARVRTAGTDTTAAPHYLAPLQAPATSNGVSTVRPPSPVLTTGAKTRGAVRRQNTAETRQAPETLHPAKRPPRIAIAAVPDGRTTADVPSAKAAPRSCSTLSPACGKPLALLPYGAAPQPPSAARPAILSRTWLGGSSDAAIW